MAGAPRKPKWAIEKDKRRRSGADRVWLFGLHSVRDALENPMRVRHRLIVTPNAQIKLEEAIATSGMTPEVADPRKFTAPLDPQSVHQGAALEADPLSWGSLQDLARPHSKDPNPLIVALDRVTDPHNVGAILRSAEVFGARAVVAPLHHSAPETGALAKTASGALERQPYLRVRNLAGSLETLKQSGYAIYGLDGEAAHELDAKINHEPNRPICLVLGAEGPGLRQKTRETCDDLVRIAPAGEFGSLNVSNATAVALYAARRQKA
ncbi:MAG: 23S rRNA (guanosine(2251)-2'-O)-methyltransferase RlmB [Pseudomonadota bacterium]